jgi:SNF2 family DNA or RNA helicase
VTVYAELDPDLPDKIKLAAEFRFKELINSLPGSSWVNHTYGNAWRVPLSWQSCLALRTTFKDDLVVGPNLVAWSTDYYGARVAPGLALRSQTDYDLPGYDGLLYPFQKAGVKFLATARRGILTDGLGAGKTRQALATLRYLYETGENPFPALVVAPNSTLYSWARESDVVWPGLKVNVIKGPMGKRRKLIEDKAHIYVINWEGVRAHSRLAPYGSIALKRCAACGGDDPDVRESACHVHEREFNRINFRTVIADEIHRAKDAKSQQTRALKAATGDAPFRIAMSNTPISSAPDDLWSPLNWLMPEAYPSKTKYTDRFLDLSFNAWGQPTVVGVKSHMKAEFFGGLDPMLRHMPKEVVLSHLPPIVYERRDVEMLPKQQKAYDQMKNQMIAELENNELLITTSPLTKMTRMLQFASAYAEIEQREVTVKDKATGEQRRETRDFVVLKEPSNKLDAFMDDLDDYGDESIVVFAVSRQLIELLSARMTKAKIPHGLITGAQTVEERQEYMDAFQAGQIKYILCTVAAGGTGITLTRGSVMVFLQRSWSMIDNKQAEGRAHRIGSEIHDVIRVVDYVTPGSVEEGVHRAVANKSDQLEQILRSKDFIKKMLEKNDVPEVEGREIGGDLDELRGEDSDDE